MTMDLSNIHVWDIILIWIKTLYIMMMMMMMIEHRSHKDNEIDHWIGIDCNYL